MSPQSQSSDDKSVDEEPQKLFGWWRFTPCCLQRFHHRWALLLCLSLNIHVIMSIAGGFVPVSLTTVEQRFYLSSFKMGLWSASFDVGVIICLIPLMIYSAKIHKGKVIWIGMIVAAIGCLVTTIPHLYSGDYTMNIKVGSDSETCAGTHEEDVNADYVRAMRNNWYVFLLGGLLLGIGAGPMFVLGVTYIDGNVAKKKSPMYLGIYTMSLHLGGATGLLLGSRLLNVWGDWDKIAFENTTLHSMDEEDRLESFYGAWWMSFALGAALLTLLAIPMSAFASKIPVVATSTGARTRSLTESADQSQMAEQCVPISIVKRVTNKKWNVCHNLKNILSNVSYVLATIKMMGNHFILSGLGIFMPKLLEMNFNVPRTTAPLIVAMCLIFAGASGILLGSIITTKVQPGRRGMFFHSVISQTISLACCFGFLITCPTMTTIGINSPYAADAALNVSSPLTSQCNVNCNCVSHYSPVCDAENNVNYVSACHAGCKFRLADRDNGTKRYTHCDCLTTNGTRDVVEGTCPPKEEHPCRPQLVLFLALVVVHIMASTSDMIPLQQIVLRSVTKKMHTMALGMQFMSLRMFGRLPGVAILGVTFDTLCSVWRESENTGQRVKCEQYNSLNVRLFTIVVVAKLVQMIAVSVGFAYSMYRHRQRISGSNLNTTSLMESKEETERATHASHPSSNYDDTSGDSETNVPDPISAWAASLHRRKRRRSKLKYSRRPTLAVDRDDGGNKK